MTEFAKTNFKNLLDKFLIFNLGIIFAGFFLFILGVIFSLRGLDTPYMIFQRLWFPLFIPALSTFFTAILIEFCLSLLKNSNK
tara:strand:- start:513 stop:761 length:249 start_codon:yes stop_codon:yes gene_type:complete